VTSAFLVSVLTFGFVVSGFYALRLAVRTIRGGLDPGVEARLRELEAPLDGPRSRITILRNVARGEVPAWLRSPELVSRLERLLVQAGSTLSPGELVLALVVSFGVGASLGVVLRLPWLSVAATGLLAAAVPIIVLRVKRARRFRKLTAQLPEALDLMVSSLRAGHAYTAAIQVAAEELEDPLAFEFQTMSDQYRMGLGQRECMKLLLERVNTPDLRLFATAVLIQIETGGSLAEVLEKLADVIRARFKLAGQIRAITAEGRLSGAILGLLPIAVGIIITILNPEYLKPLFSERLGQVMLAAALVLEFLGFLWIRRIVEVEA
jgi:tight adherence protein B